MVVINLYKILDYIGSEIEHEIGKIEDNVYNRAIEEQEEGNKEDSEHFFELSDLLTEIRVCGFKLSKLAKKYNELQMRKELEKS